MLAGLLESTRRRDVRCDGAALRFRTPVVRIPRCNPKGKFGYRTIVMIQGVFFAPGQFCTPVTLLPDKVPE